MKLNFGKTLSLKQAATAIMAAPQLRFYLQGEPGIGKSSLMGAFEAAFGDRYAYCYFDCAQKELGDIAMPVVNRELRVTEYYPNSILQLQSGKPVVIMLDEFGKAPAPIQNMLHPLLEPRNPRLGDVPLPEGSIVFLTGNLSGDGVGDKIKAHTINRCVVVNVRKSDSDEWLEWAAVNGINAIMMAFVHQYPQVMASYQDEGQDENHHIFNPRKLQTAYFSPRSAAAASKILDVRHLMDTDTLIACLSGTIGEASARDLQAFVDYQDQLPKWDDIISDPDKAKIPEGAGACSVLIFGAIQKLDKQNIAAFMQYVGRFEPEWQACFAINVARNPQKQAIAFSSKSFADWVRKNEDLL